MVPRRELTARVDAALADAGRSLMRRAARAAADGPDRLVHRPRVAIEHAAQQAVLDAPDLPTDSGPQRIRAPSLLEPADPHSSSASHARTASREKRHSSPTLRAGISLRSAMPITV